MDAYFGVDFYGNGEVVNLGELKKCEIVFDDYDNWKSYTDINKVIELYNVKKYIDTGIRLEDWTNPQYTDYQNKANQVFGVVGCFLNSNEYLCLAYEKTENDPLKDALKNNKLLVENTLFSRPEQDYLDYLLNKHKFSNGLDLRNKYIHSTNSLDEKVHRDDYMRFLIVMAIIIIKINEEFCLKEKLKK